MTTPEHNNNIEQLHVPFRAHRRDISVSPEPSPLSDLLRSLAGAALPPPVPDGPTPGSIWRVRKGATLLHEGDKLQSVFVLRSGSMKRIRTLEDGYEQVLSFAQPGELLGFEGIHGGQQPASVVALDNVTVWALPTSGRSLSFMHNAALEQAVHFALSRQLARLADTAGMVAAVASDVRLARFLFWMAGCRKEAGLSTQRWVLPMCRRDIASMLGIAHETLSRAFTLLAELQLIEVQNREVTVLDFDGLRLRGLSTRRPCDEVRRPASQASFGPTPGWPLGWLCGHSTA